jgi:hypothetical protein
LAGLHHAARGVEPTCPSPEPSGLAETPSLFACAAAETASPESPAATTDLAYSKDFWNARFGFHALGDFPGFTTVDPTVFDQVFATDFDPVAGGGANRFGTVDLATGALTTLSNSNPVGEFEGAIQNVCVDLIFADGFESGDTTGWNTTVP